MRVTGGSFSTNWPDGSLFSPVPGQIIEVDDADTDRVAFLNRLADEGLVTIVEDVKVKPTATTTAAESAPRRGRPPLPRDAEGKVVRE